MTILVIAEHDNKVLAPATLNTVAAAAEIGGDIHVLVAGQGAGAVAEAAAQVAVERVYSCSGVQVNGFYRINDWPVESPVFRLYGWVFNFCL